jgi:hypothetical protein
MDLDLKPSIITKMNLDKNNSPISINTTEEQSVHTLKHLIQTGGIIDDHKSIKIIDRDMIEVFNQDDISNIDEYYINYSNGTIYFHPDLAGQSVKYVYGNLGVELVSANRVFTKQDKFGNVIELLQDIIDQGRDAIELIKTLGNAVIIITKLNENIIIGQELHEDLTEDITIGTQLITDLEDKNHIAENTIATLIQKTETGNEVINELTEKTTLANQKKQELETTTNNANDKNVELTNTTETAKQTDVTLQQTIISGQDSINKINATGNKSLIIGASQFVNNEYTWTHNMNSKELHVTFFDSILDEPLNQDYKLIDKNNILIKNSVEHPNIKVVLSASYYQGNAMFGTTTEEFSGDSIVNSNNNVRLKDENGIYQSPVTNSDVVFMPDGNTKLTKKIDNIDSQLADKVNTTSIVNDLNVGGVSKVLSAEQGKVLKGLVDSKVDKSLIINDLTSGGADKVLSAEQGIVIDKKINAISNNIENEKILPRNSKSTNSKTTTSILFNLTEKENLQGLTYFNGYYYCGFSLDNNIGKISKYDMSGTFISSTGNLNIGHCAELSYRVKTNKIYSVSGGETSPTVVYSIDYEGKRIDNTITLADLGNSGLLAIDNVRDIMIVVATKTGGDLGNPTFYFVTFDGEILESFTINYQGIPQGLEFINDRIYYLVNSSDRNVNKLIEIDKKGNILYETEFNLDKSEPQGMCLAEVDGNNTLSFAKNIYLSDGNSNSIYCITNLETNKRTSLNIYGSYARKDDKTKNYTPTMINFGIRKISGKWEVMNWGNFIANSDNVVESITAGMNSTSGYYDITVKLKAKMYSVAHCIATPEQGMFIDGYDCQGQPDSDGLSISIKIRDITSKAIVDPNKLKDLNGVVITLIGGMLT